MKVVGHKTKCQYIHDGLARLPSIMRFNLIILIILGRSRVVVTVVGRGRIGVIKLK